MLTVEYLDKFCLVTFEEHQVVVPKPMGEEIEKLQIENKQLKIQLEEK